MTEKIFKNFLNRKNFETLITSFNGYEKACVVAPLVKDVIGDDTDNDFIITMISKLLHDSAKQLSEDAIELLNLKHGDKKYLSIQSNKDINEYLPQVRVLIKETENKSTEDAEDVFDEVVKENKHLKRKVKKLYKMLKEFERQQESTTDETTETNQEDEEDEHRLVEDENIRDIFF